MCHNSIEMQQNSAEQIEKFLQHGLPKKAVKSVAYTLKKRAMAAANASSSSSSCSSSSSGSDHEAMTFSDSEYKSLQTSNNNNVQKKTTTTAAATTILRCPVTSKVINLADVQTSATKQLNNGDGDGVGVGLGGGGKANADAATSSELYTDLLALGTQLTKQFSERCAHVALALQKTKLYILLTRTTQPAHIIAISVLALVLYTLWPEFLQQAAAATDQSKSEIVKQQSTCSTLMAIVYLAAFATHFGSQIWMTFVSGLSLYFSLPRHTFGQCQQILFPRYFTLNATLSIGMLIIYMKNFYNGWTTAGGIQITALALSALIEVTVRLYLAPPMLRLMHEKYRIEDAIGSGQEVGSLVAGDLMQCPHYKRIHKAFRHIHMTIAMGNMLVLLATCTHLFYLAAKIQIN